MLCGRQSGAPSNVVSDNSFSSRLKPSKFKATGEVSGLGESNLTRVKLALRLLLCLLVVSQALAETESVTVRAWQRSCFGGNAFETETWVRQGDLLVSTRTGKTLEAAFIEELRQNALNASQDPSQIATEWGWDKARFEARAHEGYTYEDFQLIAAEQARSPGDRSYSGLSLTIEGPNPMVILGQWGLNWTIREPGRADRLVFSRKLSAQLASLIPPNKMFSFRLERDPYAEDEHVPWVFTASNWLLVAKARRAAELSLRSAGLTFQFEVDQAGGSSTTLRSLSGPIELVRVPENLALGEVPRTYVQACQVLKALPWLEEWHAQGERTFMLDLSTPVITNPQRWSHPSDVSGAPAAFLKSNLDNLD
jgi:hypothetical protein